MKFIFLISSTFLFSFYSLGNVDEVKTPLISVEINQSVVSGKVTLPPTSATSTRRFRGSAYRNRGASASTSNQNSQSNPYLNTVVSLHPLSFELTEISVSDSVQIIQKDARFIPQVTPVTVGSIVQFVNDDSFYHNVFSLTPGAKFNIGRRPTGDIYSKEVPPTRWKVSGLGPIDLFCDIHSQMNAIILSLDTPYFSRLNEDGSFSLSNIPSGTYELRVYNRRFDLYTQEISVSDNEQIDININVLN